MSEPHITPQRLARLRQTLHAQGLAACLIPSSDPHLSEYLPERWRGREWLSGFTGSVGLLIVCADFAGLWVDSRYWDQAEKQLAGSGVTVMKIQAGQANAHLDWLTTHIAAGQTVAVDAMVFGWSAARALSEALAAARIELRSDLDVLEAIWNDRPALPDAPVYEHAPAYAGLTRRDKLASLRAALATSGASWHFISTLDDIAWLLNLRGADVNFNPVFLSHALIGPDEAWLFVGEGKINSQSSAALAADGVNVVAYQHALPRLATLPGDAVLLLDPRRVTLGVRNAIPQGIKIVEATNPTTFAKSRKTAAQATHVRHAMERDGAALCEFFAWFEPALLQGGLTEIDVADKLLAARSRRDGFISPSFATIAAFNANGAMPHYHATPSSHARIEGDGLLLIDSGGQYPDGTTDITRVVPVGTPSAAQRRDFTLVLKGLIALSVTLFPAGIRSPLLDAIARAPIWAAGVDYGHGTGHGVGYFLNVHEGPQVISYHAPAETFTAMQAGMITSIEPGIYRPGQWGVRIENLVMNQPADSTPFGDFLRFETLTLCPIDSRCIDFALLRDDERHWLNAYHEVVRKRLAPLVNGDALAWLEQRTAAV